MAAIQFVRGGLTRRLSALHVRGMLQKSDFCAIVGVLYVCPDAGVCYAKKEKSKDSERPMKTDAVMGLVHQAHEDGLELTV